MSLFDRLKSDNNRMLIDDMLDVILTNSLGVSQTGKARPTAIGLGINQLGLPIAADKWTLAFNIIEFQSIVGENETFKNWQASWISATGKSILGKFNQIMVDDTLGYVSVTLQRVQL